MEKEGLRKICYVITNGAIGGATMHLIELIDKLPPNIKTYVVVGADREWLSTKLSAYPNVTIYHLPSIVRPIALFTDAKAVWQLSNLVREIRPDIIHCHSSKAGIIGRICGWLCSTPVVFTAHGWAFTDGVSRYKRLIYGVIERFAARVTSAIITVSDYDKELGISLMPGQKDKIVTIHNGIKQTVNLRNRLTARQPGEALRLIMIARFNEPKDYAQLLKALAILKRKHIPFRASFVGDGPLFASSVCFAKFLGIEDHVDFLGERTDAAELLAEQDAFVLTSKWEGLPISILEAMRASLPVVASDVGGVREAVINHITGFLIPRGDAETLAERLLELYRDVKLRRLMGLRGQQHFRRNFTSNAMVKKIMDVYDAV